MRLGELISYLFTVLVVAALVAMVVVLLLYIIHTVISLIVYVIRGIDLPDMYVWQIYLIATIVLFVIFSIRLTDKYSEAEFNDEFTIVNSIEYCDGEIRADGELFDKDHIVCYKDLPYDVVIEGEAYKNKGLKGIGLEKVPYRKLIIGCNTYLKLKDLIYIFEDSTKSYESTKKVLEILENNKKHSEFVIGNGDEEIKDYVTVVSIRGTRQEKLEEQGDKENKNEVTALKNEIAEYKNKVEKLEQENKELKRSKKSELSNDEKALKWAMRFIIILWIISISSYVIVKYTKSRFKE